MNLITDQFKKLNDFYPIRLVMGLFYHFHTTTFNKSLFIKCLLVVSIILPVVFSLVNVPFFYTTTLSAYFLFVLAAGFTAILAGYLNISSWLNANFSKPVLFIGLWCLYIILYGFIYGNANQYQVYVFINFIFLLACILVFSHPRFSFTLLFQLLLVLSFIESLICLGQYAGWLNSNNKYFTVTGTCSNPNITAMFMAMTLPLGIVLLNSGKIKTNRIIYALTGIILIALLLLKCRTAIIGGALGIAVFLALKYKLLAWVKNRKNRAALLLLVITGLGMALFLGKLIYTTKQASADGRKLIWKVSAGMIVEKPLSGYGYGFFEQQYNLSQARYIANGQVTPAELEHAGHVNMAYNEFLENAVEGGLPGLLLFLAMLLSVILIPVEKMIKPLQEQENKPLTKKVTKYKNEAGELNASYLIAAYAGIIVFCCMSVFNFTLQAIPVMALFFLYVAVINQYLPAYSLSLKLPFNLQRIRRFAGTALILAGAGILYSQSLSAVAYRQNKIAAILLKSKQPEKAIRLLPALASRLSASESYWKNHAQALFMVKDYEGALAKIATAKQFSSNPELYQLAGKCYNRLKQYPQAMQEYQQAAYLEPTRFKPRYQLMVNAMKAGDAPVAVAIAQELITLKAKIPSSEVSRYKKEAEILLAQFNIPIVLPVKDLF